MPDAFAMAVLPYAVMVGIGVSAIASIALIVSVFSKTQHLDSEILPRLSEIVSSIAGNASRIDAQVEVISAAVEPSQVRSMVSDLYEIAHDLQGRANEVHRLLDQIESDARLPKESEDRGRIIDLGKAVLQTESQLAAVVRKIEAQKSGPPVAPSVRAMNEG